MSPSAHVAGVVPAARLHWPRPDMLAAGGEFAVPRPIPPASGPARPVDLKEAPLPPVIAERVAAIERDAFARGLAEGERQGEAAAAARTTALLARLEKTIHDVAAIRPALIRRTEGEVVRLAAAMAERVIHREITVDHRILAAIAHMALDRLGDQAGATILLHPSDYDAVTHGRGELAPGSGVQIVADPQVDRGGCVIRSPAGTVDASIAAQVAEIARALLGEPASDPEDHDRPIAD